MDSGDSLPHEGLCLRDHSPLFSSIHSLYLFPPPCIFQSITQSLTPQTALCTSTSPDMLNFPGCLAGNGADMSVLQRQQLRLSYSLLQQHHQLQPKSFDFSAMPQFQGLMLQHGSSGFPVLSAHGDGNEFRSASASSPEMATSSLDMEHSALSRTSVPAMKEELGLAAEEIEEESGLMKMMKCTVGGNSFKKRKAESTIAEESRDKRRNRGAVEEDDHSAQTPNEKSKTPDAQDQKQDYVHVRARRGQATDSHSLAERARREKINKKMKSLQELVPGCHKTTGKAGMLDEIINYVQSLQRQVEFLSMKLSHVNPRLELSIDNIFTKEFPACVAATLSEMANMSYNQHNSVQPVAANCEMDMLMPLNPLQTAQPRVSSSPVSQVQSLLPWETDLQSFYDGGFQ